MTVSFSIGQPFKPRLVITMDPVAQGLPIHAADLRRSFATIAIQSLAGQEQGLHGGKVAMSPGCFGSQPSSARVGSLEVGTSIPANSMNQPKWSAASSGVLLTTGTFRPGLVSASKWRPCPFRPSALASGWITNFIFLVLL